MGLFGSGKNKKEENAKVSDKKASKQEAVEEKSEAAMDANRTFSFGVCDVFLANETSLVAVGYVKGTICEGDSFEIVNPGDDEEGVATAVAKVLEKGDGKGNQMQLKEATDTRVAIFIEDALLLPVVVKTGSVFRSGNVSEEDIRFSYVTGIRDGYVGLKEGNLTDTDLLRMSISDLAETWHYLRLLMNSRDDADENDIFIYRDKVMRISQAMIKKLSEKKSIYVATSPRNGENFLFSRFIKKDNGLEVTPPSFMLVTEAYKRSFAQVFENENLVLKEIENGEDFKGIRQFLFESFFVNGALGMSFLYPDLVIPVDVVMPAPDYSGKSEREIPVTNPDLVRWLHLMSQMEEPKTDDEKRSYSFYARMMLSELMKAKFLVPIKLVGPAPQPGENVKAGSVTNEEGRQFKIAIQSGKNKTRDAVRFYTDGKKLCQEYGDNATSMVQTASQMIDFYDLIVNLSQNFPRAGVYINHDMYNKTKEMNERIEKAGKEIAADRADSDKADSDKAGSDKAGSDKADSDKAVSDSAEEKKDE